MIEPLLLRSGTLQKEMESLRAELEELNTWTVFTVRRRLRSFEARRSEIDAKTTQLHADMNAFLDAQKIEPIQGPTSAGLLLGFHMPQFFVELSRASRSSTQCVLAIQRLQDTSSGLGAMIERKYAYLLAFVSLYVGLLSTLVSTIVGL